MKESTKLLGSLTALIGMVGTSFANPIGENVVAGSATVSRDGDILTVVTGSDRTIIDWDTFSIGTDQLANFVQPGVDSAVLNRVIGTMPTEILGSLLSNGQVALINPNGILIDRSGVVDTRGFTASTLDVSNEAFLANQNLTFSGSGAGVENRGAIIVREGDVFLLGQTVKNTGEIKAENVSLAAGSKIVLKKDGDDHLYVEVETSDESNTVTNAGNIEAVRSNLRDNGNNPYEYAMARDESQSATGYHVNAQGQVILSAGGGGNVVQSGAITAKASPTQGGNVVLEARTVDVQAEAIIDVSAEETGGTVEVGGGFQGQEEAIENSIVTRVQSGAVIDASGGDQGGRVIIWSDGNTFYGGDIIATGGTGGFAEVSGKAFLSFQGGVDLDGGQLLLDPQDILIVDGPSDIDGDGNFDNGLGDILTGDIAAGDIPVAGTSQIAPDQIEALLATTDLSLAATDTISVNSPITWDGMGGGGGTTSLTLEANQITISESISATNGSFFATASGGTIDLSLGVGISADNIGLRGAGGLNLSGSLSATNLLQLGTTDTTIDQINGEIDAMMVVADAGTGNVELDAATNDFGSINVTGGAVVIQETGDTDLAGITATSLDVLSTGNISQSGNLNVTGTSVLVNNGSGNIDLTNNANIFGGDVTLNGDAVRVVASGGLSVDSLTFGTNAELSLTAGGALAIPSGDLNTGTADLTLASNGGSLVTPGELNGANISLIGSAGIDFNDDDITATNNLTILTTNSSVTQDNLSDLVAGGLTTINTGSGAITLLENDNDFAQLSITGGAVSINEDNATDLVLVDVDSLDFTSDGSLTQSGAITVDGVTDINLGNNDDIILLDNSNSFGGNVLLDGQSIQVAAGGALTVDTLSPQPNNAVTLIAGGALTLPSSSINTGSADLTLSAGGVLTTPGDLSGADVSLTGSGGISLEHNVTASGDLNLTSTDNAVTQPAGDLDVGDVLNLDTGTGAATLTQAGNTFGSLNLSGGAVSIVENNASVIGSATVGGLVLTSGGTITQTGAITVTGAADLTSGNDDDLLLTDPMNDFMGTVTLSGDDVSVFDQNDLNVVSVTLEADETLTLNAGGALTLPAQDIDTGIESIVLTSGTGVLTTNGNLTGENITINSAGGISLGHDVTADTALTLGSTNTAIAQTAGTITSNNTTSITAGTGSVSLTQATNSFGALDITGGSVSVSEINGTELGTVTATDLMVASGGNITQSGILTTTAGANLTAGAGDDITLNNSANAITGPVQLNGSAISVVTTTDLSVTALTNGANEDLSLEADGVLTLPAIAINAGTGDIDLTSGGDLATAGSITGDDITLTSGATLTLGHDITGDGNLDLNGDVVTAGVITLTGSTVTIADRLSIEGDAAVGTLNVEGDLDFGTGAEIFVNETGPAMNDVIVVNGDTDASNLTVTGQAGPGTNFNVGDELVIIQNASGANSISNIPPGLTTLLNGRSFSVLLGSGANDDDLVLQRIPTSIFWTGTTSDSWSVNTNWNIGSPLLGGDIPMPGLPGNGDNLIFPESGLNAMTNHDLGTLMSVSGITFSAGNGATYTLSGLGLEIDGSGISNLSDTTQTISLAGLTLGSDQSFSSNATGGLIINSPVTGAFDLNLTGDGLITLGSVGTMAMPINSLDSIASASVILSSDVHATSMDLLGPITLAGDVSLVGVNIETEAINVGGNTLTLNGSSDVDTGAITNGNLVTETAATIESGDLGTLAVGGGELTVTTNLTTVGAITGDQTLDIDGNLVAGSTTNATVLEVAGTSNLGGNVTTTGAQTFGDQVTLSNNVTLAGTDVTAADINANAQTLTLNGSNSAMTGAVTGGNLVTQSASTIQSGDLGTLTIGGGELTVIDNLSTTGVITGAQTLDVNGDLDAGMTTNVSVLEVAGISTLGGNVTTTGAQTFDDQVTLGTNVTLAGTDITAAGIDAESNTLTLNGSNLVTTGAITDGNLVTQSAATIASADVGTVTIGGGELTVTNNLSTTGIITGAQTLDVNGDLDAGMTTSVSVLEVAGISTLGGNVTTTGAQTFDGQITLGTNVTLAGTDITAAGIDAESNTLTLNGSNSVMTGAITDGNLVTQSAATIASADVGTVTIGGGELNVTGNLTTSDAIAGAQVLDVDGDLAAGTTTNVSVLEVAGTSSLGGNVTTTGDQTLVGDTLLAADVELDGDNISTGAIDTAGNILILDGMTSANIGAITGDGSLITEMAATIASADVISVTIGGGELNVTGDLDSTGAISGAQALDVDGNLVAGSTIDVSVLEVAGTSSLGGNVTTTGNQTLEGLTTLTANVELDGDNVTTGAIDAGINTLTLDGMTSVNTGAITGGDLITETAATIESGQVGTLMIGGGELTVTNDLTAFGTITGAQTLDVDGNFSAGSTTNISVLEVAGTSSLGGNVNTTGNQTYEGLITLNSDVELEGDNISTVAIDLNNNTLVLDGITSVSTGALSNGDLVTESAATIDSADIGTLTIGGGELTVTNDLTTMDTISGAETLDIDGNLIAGSTIDVAVLEVLGTSSLNGNVTTTGAQTLSGATTLLTDVSLIGDTVSTDSIDAGGNTLTLNGVTSVSTGAITNGDLVTETAATIASGDVSSVTIGGGELNVTGNLSSTGVITGAQTLDIDGNLISGSTIDVSVLEVAGTSSLGGNVTTSGNQTFGGDTNLTADVELDGAAIVAGAINAGGSTLTLDGSTSVNVGAVTNGALVTETLATVGSANVTSLTTAAGLNSPGSVTVSGASTLGGDLVTVGDISLNGPTTLTTNVLLDGAVVTTQDIEAGTNTLTLDGATSVSTGAISNGDLVTLTAATVDSADVTSVMIGGGELNVTNNLSVTGTISGAQTLDVDGDLNAQSTTNVVTLEVAGESTLGGNVTTTGNQTFVGDITLTSGVELDGSVIVTGGIDADGFTLTLDGAVSVDAGQIDDGNLITQTAATIAGGDLTNVTIGGGELTVVGDLSADTITGAQTLDVNGNLATTGITNVSVLEVAGTSSLGGNVTTTGSQTFEDQMTLTTDVELDGTVIAAVGIDNGGNTLTLDGSTSVNTGAITNGALITQTAATIDSGNLTTLSIAGGALKVNNNLETTGSITGNQLLTVCGDLTSGDILTASTLIVEGSSNIGGDVTTTGNQTYTGPMTLSDDAELDGLVISTGAIDGGGNTLTLDGFTSVNTGAITNGNVVTQTAATIESADIGTLDVNNGTLTIGDLTASGAITGDQLLDVNGNLISQTSLEASVLEVAGTSELSGSVTTVGNQTYNGAVTTQGPVNLTGNDLIAVNASNDFNGLVTVDGNVVTLVDSDNLAIAGDTVGDLVLNVGADSSGQSLTFEELTVGGNLLVEATGNVVQIAKAEVTGETRVTSTGGVINLDINENNFIDEVTLTGDQITVSNSTRLRLGNIITTSAPTDEKPDNGTFTLNASAGVVQRPGSSVNVTRLGGSIQGNNDIILYNDGNQIDEIGNFTITGGGDLIVRDNGRRGTGAEPALTVTGDINAEGSVWLVVDAQDDSDFEGLTVNSETGSISVSGEGESLILIGGLNDVEGLSGRGELVIRQQGRADFVKVEDNAAAYLVFNTVDASSGGSDLTGVDIAAFNSLNFSFDPVERQDGSISHFAGELVSRASAAQPFDTKLSSVGPGATPDARVVSSPLTQAFGFRVPSFIESPSFLFTPAARIEVDTASQAGDVAALTREFFADLQAVAEVSTLTADEIAAIRDVSRFEGGAIAEFYGPFAILSYEYDWWLAENDQKPGIRLEASEKIYNGKYPLYLYKAQDGTIKPAIEE